MACGSLQTFFARETGRILPVFRERGRVRSWWASLGGNGLRSEPWPWEMGDTVSRDILERTIPTTTPEWTSISANPNGTLTGGSTCNPTAVVVPTAITQRTTQLYQTAVKTDWLCVQDIQSAVNFRRQVAWILKNLADNVTDMWEDQNRRQYVALAQNKLVFNPDLPIKTNGTTMTDFPSEQATSTITQKYLNRLRVRLQQNAAGADGGAYAREDGGDVYAIVLSTEMQEALFTTSSRINWDRRFAEAPKLLKAYGVNRSYQGWFHIIDDKAPRFDWVNGAYVERPYYATGATTYGNRANVNPDYLAAEFEMVIPFLKTVVTRMIPKSFTSAGSGTSYKAWNYAGTPQWMNPWVQDCNEYNKNGYWSVLMQAAYMPEMIENGYAIMCKRPCSDDLEMVTCDDS